MNLRDMLRQFRWPVALALSLVIIEQVAWIAEPSVFGPVIDGMVDRAANRLAGKPHPLPVGALSLWIGVFLVNSGVGAVRRSLDQRIYLRMYADVAAEVSRTSIERNLSLSQATARGQLSREFITFLQYRVPEVFEQIINVVGALAGMALFDWRLSLACGLVVVPLLLINWVYRARVGKIQASIHDRLEHLYDIFGAKDPEHVRSYFRALAGPQQQLANWGAASFALVRLFLLGIFLVVVWVAIDLDDFTTGNLYTTVAYLWTIVTSTEYLPELLESWSSLRDIGQRIRAVE
jgi:ABC-type multidrug transport system fused ATPase/permease subunit